LGEPAKLAKAELHEILFHENGSVTDGNKQNRVTVQFNPETLTVTFSNQTSGGDQRGGGAIQYVGKGTTKLTMDLWFDITVPGPDSAAIQAGDVREATKRVAYYMTPKPVQGKKDKFIPPGVRFLWGTFLFEGIMDSLTEKLEFFSAEGKPLRAMLSVSLTSQSIQYRFNPQGGAQQQAAAGAASAGAAPQQPAKAGDTVQSMSQAAGQQDWKGVAQANKIENPRQVPPGTLVNTSPRR